MNLVLDVKVDQGHESAEEAPGQVFPIFDGLGVRRAQGNATGCPRDGQDKVGNHQNVVPVVVISRRDICPPAACQGPDDAEERDRFGEGAAGFRGEQVPQSHERKSWPCSSSSAKAPKKGQGGHGHTRSNGDEEHEDGAFGIAVANGGRDGWEPLVRVAIPLILDDLAVMQRGADDEGAEERNCEKVNISIRQIQSWPCYAR